MPSEADELLRACGRGDQHAWNELVERYGRLVYSIPRRYGLDAADCDDIFQSVFSALFGGLQDIRDGQSLPRWLITTAHRAVWRKRRRDREAVRGWGAGGGGDGRGDRDPPDPAGPAFSEVERLEQQQLIHDALLELGDRCGRLLRALFLERPPPGYEELATRLSMPHGSIGPTRRRCLEKLALLLHQRGVLEGLAGAGAAQRRT